MSYKLAGQHNVREPITDQRVLPKKFQKDSSWEHQRFFHVHDKSVWCDGHYLYRFNIANHLWESVYDDMVAQKKGPATLICLRLIRSKGQHIWE